MSPEPLTEHLISLYPSILSRATTHPFLAAAGSGDLTSDTPLCKWLVQDKYYQCAYVNFAGRMIAKLNLAAHPINKHSKETFEWKTLETLMAALQAVKTEMEFYDRTADRYALSLDDMGEDEVTKQYRELFYESSKEEVPVVWGLTVLWATEYVYLKAWTFAKSKQTSQQDEGAIGALHKEFIPNWTNDDFKAAVDNLADVANGWAKLADDGVLKRCSELWLRVLELEERFWPNI